MKKYDVYAKVCGSKYFGEYEAESPEEAIEMAEEEEGCNISLCLSCADQVELGDLYDFEAVEAKQATTSGE